MSENEDNVVRRMAQMRQAFIDSLDERVAGLTMPIAALQAEGSDSDRRAALETLSNTAHKLVGAAGTFGLMEISAIARDVEQMAMNGLRDPHKITPADVAKLERLADRIDVVASSQSDAAVYDAPLWNLANRQAGEERTVIVVDDDPAFINHMERHLSLFGFKVIALLDHAELRRVLESTSPQVLMMDIVFPDATDAGVAAVRALQDAGVLDCPVIFVSARGDFDARLGAVRLGCMGYLVKPVDVVELVDLLEQVTGSVASEAYRVLVVDDDSYVSRFNAALLESAGIETAIVNDPLRIMAPLRELKPDVILMDIQMPQCNGFELAQVIRQDSNFFDLPIIFLTGSAVENAWLLAMESGANEFLLKSIAPNELLASVIGRARQSRVLGDVMGRLRGSEARFRSLAESANEAIMTIDQEGRVVYWNKAAEEIFGFTPNDILGARASILVPENERAEFQRGMDEFCKGGRCWRALVPGGR